MQLPSKLKRTKKVLTLILVISCAVCVHAQSLRVQSSFDTLYLGNTLSLTFTLENGDGEIDIDLSNLPVVGGPQVSSSVQIINGDRSSSKSITYYLQPEESGVLFIPEAIVVASDVTLSTEAFTIMVLDNPNGIVQKEKGFGSRQLFFDTPFRNNKPVVPAKPKRRLRKI